MKSKVENGEVIEEFRNMRRLMGYGQIWKYHPMGVGRDIDKWLTNALNQQRLQIVEMVEIVKFNAKAPDDTLAMTPVERGMWYKAYYQACTDIINKVGFLTKLKK